VAEPAECRLSRPGQVWSERLAILIVQWHPQCGTDGLHLRPWRLPCECRAKAHQLLDVLDRFLIAQRREIAHEAELERVEPPMPLVWAPCAMPFLVQHEVDDVHPLRLRASQLPPKRFQPT